MKWIDTRIIDGVVNFAGRAMWGVGQFAGMVDKNVVDGMVNWTGDTTMAAGQAMRQMQTGRIQQYAYFTFAGALGLAALFFLDIF
jgi:NADH-quinone oxidoreductase subunit L